MVQLIGLLTQREPLMVLQVLNEKYTAVLNTPVPSDDVNPATGYVSVASLRYRESEALGKTFLSLVSTSTVLFICPVVAHVFKEPYWISCLATCPTASIPMTPCRLPNSCW